MDWLQILGYAGAGLGMVSQYAAMSGKPKLVSKVKMVSTLFDLAAGNYFRSRNQDK